MEKKKNRLGNVQSFSQINSVGDGIKDRKKAVDEILNPNGIREGIKDRNKAFEEIFEDEPNKPSTKKKRGY